MVSMVVNHLWQSTLFAVAAGLLTAIFRNNGAHIRHWLWLSASIKFLLPFSVLIVLGSQLASHTAPVSATSASTPEQWSALMERITQPMAGSVRVRGMDLRSCNRTALFVASMAPNQRDTACRAALSRTPPPGSTHRGEVFVHYDGAGHHRDLSSRVGDAARDQ
jgi:hypothetical protein